MKKLFLLILAMAFLCPLLRAQDDDDAYLKRKKRIVIVSGSGGSFITGEVLQTATDNNANLPLANIFTTGTGASGYTVTKLEIWDSDATSHTIRGGLYTTSGNNPNTLICQSGAITGGTSGWTDVTPTGCGTLLASTQYAMARIDNDANNTEGKADSAGGGGVGIFCPGAPIAQSFTVFSTTQGSTLLPSSWGGTTNATTECWSMRVTLTAVGSLGTTPTRLTLVDFSGLSNATTITQTTMNNSVKGCGGDIGKFLSGTFTNLQGSTTAPKALLNSHTVCTSSSSGSSTIGLTWLTNNSGAHTIGLPILQNANKSTAIGTWLCWTMTTAGDSTDAYSNLELINAGGTDFSIIQIFDGVIRLEGNGGASAGVSVTDGSTCSSSDNWYWVTMQYNGGATHKMRVYDKTGTQLGTEQTFAASGNVTADTMLFGITGAESEVAGKNIYWNNVLIDPTGASYPILP